MKIFGLFPLEFDDFSFLADLINLAVTFSTGVSVNFLITSSDAARIFPYRSARSFGPM